MKLPGTILFVAADPILPTLTRCHSNTYMWHLHVKYDGDDNDHSYLESAGLPNNRILKIPSKVSISVTQDNSIPSLCPNHNLS